VKKFWELRSLFAQAYSHTRAVITIGVSLVAALGTTERASEIIRTLFDENAPAVKAGGTLMLGVPSWMWGVTVFVSCLFVWMTQTSLRLQRALTPRIQLDFRPTAEGIVQTRTEIWSQDGNKPIKIRDDRAIYVRITINCLSKKTVGGCVAFITKLEKGTIQGGNFVDIPLHGSISLTPTPIDIYPRVQNVIDFLKAGETDNKLEGSTPWPFRLDGH
jgi:hypothetical protein